METTRFNTFALFFIVVVSTVSCAPSVKPGECSECPAGSGVVRPCNISADGIVLSDTECEPCASGETFSDSASRYGACRTCRTCPANSRVVRECDATHDTECECERDFYQEMVMPSTLTNNEDQEADTTDAIPQQASTEPVMVCRACDLCPHGYGAARACSSTHNTVCRKCPASTYSSVLSSSLGCSVCTVCRDDQVTLHECTPIMDTVCADKTMGHPSRRVITKPLEPIVHQPAEEEYNNEGIISVYCAILGAIVLGLLIYVIMKQWKLRKAANKLAHFDPRNGSASVPLNPPESHSPPLSKMIDGHKFNNEISPSGSRRLHQHSDGSRGSDSEFGNAVPAPGSDGHGREIKPITPDTRLRDICTAKRREMEAMLNGRRDHHDWKALARDLGYTSTRIASFEQRSTAAETTKSSPTRHLFGDWAKREDSTVKNLIASLVNIGRHDVTLVLMPLMTNQAPVHQQPTRSTLPRTANNSRSYKPISVV